MDAWVKRGNIRGPLGGTFPDAPSDDVAYARKNADWTPAAEAADLIDEMNARVAADNALAAALNDEIADRQAADADLAGDIATVAGDLTLETNNRISADAGLQTQINLKAPLDSPALTGNPTAPTPTAGDNDTSIATTAFVQAATLPGTYPEKASIVDGDNLSGFDSAASYGKSRWSWLNIKTTLMAAIGAAIAAATNKATLVAADKFLIADSAASNANKHHTFANLQTMLEVSGGLRLGPSQFNNYLTDCDTATKSGWYGIANTTANNPFPGTSGYGPMHVIALSDAGGVKQLAYGYNGTNAGRVWERTKDASVWTAWREVGREKLTANRNYYCRTDGNDANNGQANNAAGAFRTIAKALEVLAANVDFGGFTVTVNVAAGTFNEQINVPLMVGQSDASKLVINGVGATTIFTYAGAYGDAVAVCTVPGAGATIQNCDLRSTAAASTGCCLDAENGGRLVGGAGLTLSGTNTPLWAAVRAAAQGTVQVSGFTLSTNAGNVFSAQFGGYLEIFSGTYALGTRTVTQTASAQATGVIFATGSHTFTGTVTGTRYSVTTNAVIWSPTGVNFFPGTVAGTTATGGQYV